MEKYFNQQKEKLSQGRLQRNGKGSKHTSLILTTLRNSSFSREPYHFILLIFSSPIVFLTLSKWFLQYGNVFDNNIIFVAFVVFWSGYGILYKTNEEVKNIGYNVLDLFSKCFVGIFFWAYLTKVLVIF